MATLSRARSAHRHWSTSLSGRRHQLSRAVAALLAACALLLVAAGTASALGNDSKFVAALSSQRILIAKNHSGTVWVKLFMAQPNKSAEWGAWQSLGMTPGGPAVGRPQIVSWSADHADVYVRGENKILYHRWWNGSVWASWSQVGTSKLADDPSIVSWGYGRIDLFARDINDTLVHNSFENNWQNDWDSLGGSIEGRPSAISWQGGHLDVYVRGKNNNRLWHRWWAVNVGWSQFEAVGDQTIGGSPVAITRAYGDINVYARGSQGDLVGTSFANNAWQGWGTLGGGMVGDPSPVSWGTGHVDVYIRGTDNQVWHRWWGTGAGWSAWENTSSGAVAGNPAAITLKNGHVDVYDDRTSGEVVDRWFDQTWQPAWESRGLPAHSFMGERTCKAASPWNADSMLGLSLGLYASRVTSAQLGTFDNVISCLRGVSSYRKVGLRMQLRYDSGVPDGNNNPELAAFAQLLARVPNVQPIVSVMSVNFDICNGGTGPDEGPKPTNVGFSQSKQARCTYPTASAFQLYFNRLVDQVQRQLGRSDVLFTVWNEPDHERFTLRYATTQDPRTNAARIAGGYWAQAVTKVPSSRLLAGEFASDGSGTLKSAFQSAAGQAPANWALHPYEDMTYAPPLGSQPFGTTDVFQNRLQGAPLWLTEIGVQANVDGSLANSLARGADLRGRLGLSSRGTKAILYDLTTNNPNGTNGTHDSSLTDDLGRARPVLCGLGDVQVHSCVGNPTRGGDENY